MKIGINGRFLLHEFTGIGQYAKNLLTFLSKIDSVNSYLIVVPDKVDHHYPANFKLVVLPEINFGTAGFKKFWWEQYQVPKLFQTEKVDLAHFFYPANPFLNFDFKKIVTVHDVIPWKRKEYCSSFLSRCYHRLSKKNLLKADLLITVSKTVKNQLLELCPLIPAEKIKIIYNAAAPSYQEKISTAEKKHILTKFGLTAPFFLYTGGFDQRKNTLLLVQAWLKTLASKISLVLVGGNLFDTPLYADFKAIKKLKNEHLFLPGFVTEAELKVLYQECLAFVHLSAEEGFNIPLVEAATSGAPLILSKIPVHQEIAGENALFCDPANLSSVTEALNAMINNQPLRNKLKAKSLLLASPYSWETSAKQVKNLYETIV